MSDIDLQELGLLLLFLVYSSGMFIQSYSFSYGAAIFPRYLSAIIIVGVVSLISFSFISSQFTNSLFDVFDPDTVVGAETDIDAFIDPHHEILLLTFLFIVLGYLVGLLWVAPVFTYFYLSRANKEIKSRIILTGIVMGIGLVFFFILDAPIANGVIQTW